jgi:YaiO family outer membrane protein
VNVVRGGTLALVALAGLAIASRSAGSQITPLSLPSPAPAAETPPLDDLRRLTVRYQYDDLSDVDSWHDASVMLAQRTRLGSVIAGVNAARRYDDTGLQYELQAYPLLTRRSYLALNGAWSPSRSVFIPLRLSAEPYYNFASGWETSAGVRYFQTPGPDVFVYTGTLAKYFGNYWVSARPHLTGFSGDDSYGGELTGRRYFSHRYDYVGLLVSRSIGVSLDALDPQRLTQRARLSGFLARLERRQPLGASPFRVMYGAGYERQQMAAGRVRRHHMAVAGIEWFVP